ncbi:ATP-binding protein [Pelosinus sp. IPA-1]|uniref:Lon protease family protein n=1 Tax=Pelosinus sp. IPA-1 TaxID=3029569 RepID=UPI00243622B7|nr:ATP-binding protein [Pelosinus sp. IPA-1]GMB02143.1 ATP-dependent protease [Pelosinus sp. IPA-1]
MTKYPELPVDKLRFTCDETLFNFETTASISPLDVMIGQKRAVKAVEFGLFAKNQGYNIFISGLVGTGKITYAKSAVAKVAQEQQTPGDWCYVNNFKNSSQPIALLLPPGLGHVFCKDIEDLIEDIKTEVGKVFSSDDYESAKNETIKSFQERRTVIIDSFNQKASEYGILPQWSTTGFVGMPMKDGKTLSPEEFQSLDKEEREATEKKLLSVHEKAMEVIRRMQDLEREMREEIRKLDGKVGLYAAGNMIDEVRQKYQEHSTVVEYLEAIKADVVKNISDFKANSGEDDQSNPFAFLKKNTQDSIRDKYKVNLLVDNRELKGAPVIVESNPTYYNLVGRVEYETRMGMVSTDYTMIKAGALHKANGGYLILNARDVLTNMGAWEALKRIIKTQKLYVENLSEQYGMVAMATLKPQAVPINVKVILIGNPYLYYLMYNHDEDFGKLFKIHADFDTQMDRNEDNVKKMAGFISSAIETKELKHFDRSAVARMVEYSCRLAGSQKKLTTRFSEVVKILCEADIWATMDKSDIVTGKHVKQAIEEKRYRSNKYEEHLQEMIADGKLMIDTEDRKVGQVNGLAVMAVGEYMFGKPSRITANTYMGKGGIVNIERETKMSGTSHSKGVLILSGYIGQKYAQEYPLALTASLTFEQLYGGVDGDSASSTELYALLSSLSGVPIKQSIAITGSVNQKGEVQPIGGVTEKIEGFFSVCKIKGLTGEQGVMIPHQNVDELALNDEVIEAVSQGKFHIWAVKTIDQGIEILTDVPAGEMQEDGTYPSGSIHYLVNQQLKEYTDRLIKLSKAAEESKAQ